VPVDTQRPCKRLGEWVRAAHEYVGDWARRTVGQARLKLDLPGKAEADCSKALLLEPGHQKALVRRAAARRELKKVSAKSASPARDHCNRCAQPALPHLAPYLYSSELMLSITTLFSITYGWV
jgi:hypothetical protein